MIPDRTPDFSLRFKSQELNRLLKGSTEGEFTFTRHFNASEDFFIRLKTPVDVPSFEIHHSVHENTPSPGYLSSLFKFLQGLLPIVGPLFSETSWYFDSRDIFHPGFYQLYDIKGRKYLFAMKMDLGIHPRGCEVTVQGSNEKTPQYRTRDLYLDAEIIPIENHEESKQDFWIHHYFQQTWLGEKGRGYFVQGVWIDDSITKFISKVFLPQGRKIYPYYPFKCRYNTLSSTVVDFTPQGRHKAIILLDKALEALTPYIPRIQKILHTEEFSDNMEFFTTLRKEFEPNWSSQWKNTHTEAYLNSDEQKEYTYYD